MAVVIDQERDVLGLIDIQNCFMPADPAVPGAGELAVPDGAAVAWPWISVAAERFEVVVVVDACRGINVDGSVAATRAKLVAQGVTFVNELG